MYCQNCGTQNDDSMSFCMNCGAPLQSVRPPVQPVYAPVREDANQKALREQTKTPLFLSGAITFSAALLFRLIGAIQGKGGLMGLVDQAMAWALTYGGYEAGMYLQDLQRVIRPLGAGLTAGAVIAMIPDILLVVGIWLMFAAARKAYEPMNTTGLTIIKVVTIVQTVLFCISAVVFAIAILLVMVVTSAYYDDIIPAGLITLLILGIIVVPWILYYIKLIGTTNSISLTASQGGYNGKVSLYVAIICFLAAVAAFFGSFSGGTFGVLSGLCRTAAWIVFGIYLILYRNKAGMIPVPDTIYTPPEYQPVAPAAEPPYQSPVAPQPFVPQKAPKDDTTVLNGSSYYAQETTVLTAEPPLTVRLVRLKDNTAVIVTPPQFRIGKDPSSSDYFIGDNTAISRQHADVIIHDNAVFVVDLQSTNHVYVNGQQIPPDAEIQLTDGMELRLGDEKFRVEIS